MHLEALRYLSVNTLLKEFSKIDSNILVLGAKSVWLVNSATIHKNFYIGTERMIELKEPYRDKAKLKRLDEFVKRFANPGAKIMVFKL